MLSGSIRLDDTPHRPRRYLVSLFLPLAALFCLLKFAQIRSPRHLAVSRARQLLDRRLYSGLAVDWFHQLTKSDVRPLPEYEHVPLDERTFDMDFRTVRTVQGLNSISRFSSLHLKAKETPSYIGDTCLSHYPGQICPVPGACPPGRSDNQSLQNVLRDRGQCVHWSTGSLPSPIPEMSSEQVQEHKSKVRHSLAFDKDGFWHEDEWRPQQTSERYRFFTPEDMHTCLAGKRIYFQGDSLMRQIYNRIITYSRMIPASIEHYYGNPSSYTVYTDGTDRWEIPRDGNPSKYSRDLDQEQGVLFRAFYDWYPEEQIDLPNLFRRTFDLLYGIVSDLSKALVKLDIDIAVIGMNYWCELCSFCIQ